MYALEVHTPFSKRVLKKKFKDFSIIHKILSTNIQSYDLVTKYANNEQVNFIALSDEDELTVRKSLLRFPFNFDHVVDSKTYSDQLISGVTKHFPQVIVLNGDRNVVYEITENKSKIFNVLDSHIQEIIKL